MKILFLSTRLPHARVVSGHLIVYQRILRLAARGHQVGLAVFGREDDAAHAHEVKELVSELEIVPPPSRPWLGRRLYDYGFSAWPAVFNEFRSAEMFRRVGDLVERSRYDVVVAEFGRMGPYLHRNPYLPAVRKVISVHQCHTVASRKALETLGCSPRALREWLAMKGLRRYEFDMFRCADHLLTLSSEMRNAMQNEAPDLRVTVIPSGVDTDYYRPGFPGAREEAIVFTGYYTDEPNRDAVLWFCHTVWPRLKARRPDLVFYVVGPEPTPDLLDIARKDRQVIVTGEVDDIRPYLAKARIFVCPNRLGSGMRGKILQAMAAGTPVVSTTLSAEGINLQMGETGFLADRPRIMAEYIDLLLGDADLQARIAERARQFVVERFSWERGVGQLEDVLRQVVAARTFA